MGNPDGGSVSLCPLDNTVFPYEKKEEIQINNMIMFTYIKPIQCFYSLNEICPNGETLMTCTPLKTEWIVFFLCLKCTFYLSVGCNVNSLFIFDISLTIN